MPDELLVNMLTQERRPPTGVRCKQLRALVVEGGEEVGTASLQYKKHNTDMACHQEQRISKYLQSNRARGCFNALLILTGGYDIIETRLCPNLKKQWLIQ